MYTYANGFRFASRNDGSDVMLHFLQESPTYNENSEVIDMSNEVAAAIVMTRENALRLAIALQEALDSPTAD